MISSQRFNPPSRQAASGSEIRPTGPLEYFYCLGPLLRVRGSSAKLIWSRGHRLAPGPPPHPCPGLLVAKQWGGSQQGARLLRRT
ncbi:hypothetical protein NDU88_002835 [Pleurodeles waltl]|uniref:Uncharacterized protein n=1 Tax=Pleurodeles waltl TaxID=8319 RepID=A0AAV7L4K2_PLEWA|nr:hypothetical protein NDU88_002835 [Pleurodeles waltl]